MLPPAVVEEICRLLDATVSQRQIALATGVARNTIATIANGRRAVRQLARAGDDDDSLVPTGPLERCPSCGCRVYMPCRACGMRRRAERLGKPRRRRRRSRAKPVAHARPRNRCEETLDLRLHKNHRRRYEEVRAWRQCHPELEFPTCPCP
jgi:hypothetical protein